MTEASPGVEQPLAVFDVSRGWFPPPGFITWAISEGLNPNAVYRLDIYPGPRARVYEYVKDESGRKRLQPDGPVKRDPYDVDLTSLPPGVTS
ncbi:hypothetical protein J5X84_36255 [Streptosporangiaceae bacterium NEAU-GS5]|nr:hypothetical protein [Streptosporangiaceae bacterium NEAU-GS5]